MSGRLWGRPALLDDAGDVDGNDCMFLIVCVEIQDIHVAPPVFFCVRNLDDVPVMVV